MSRRTDTPQPTRPLDTDMHTPSMAVFAIMGAIALLATAVAGLALALGA